MALQLGPLRFERLGSGRGLGHLALEVLDLRCSPVEGVESLRRRGQRRFVLDDPIGNAFELFDADGHLLDLDGNLAGSQLRNQSHPVDPIVTKDTLQHLVSFGGARRKEFRKLALCQQHGAAERIELEAQQLGDLGVDLGLLCDGLDRLGARGVGREAIEGMLALALHSQQPGSLPHLTFDLEPQGNRSVGRPLMDEALCRGSNRRSLAVQGKRDAVEHR